MRVGRILFALVMGGAAAAAMSSVAAAPTEEELKAEVAYNILRFVKWPPGTPPAGQPLALCAQGTTGMAKSLARFDGSPVEGNSVAFKPLNRHLDGLAECHAMFIPAGDPYAVLRVSAAMHGKPVLLIAEGERALEQGAGMAVSLSGSRVVIDVDLAALNASGLTVSSKLLRLARTVIK